MNGLRENAAADATYLRPVKRTDLPARPAQTGLSHKKMMVARFCVELSVIGDKWKVGNRERVNR